MLTMEAANGLSQPDLFPSIGSGIPTSRIAELVPGYQLGVLLVTALSSDSIKNLQCANNVKTTVLHRYTTRYINLFFLNLVWYKSLYLF